MISADSVAVGTVCRGAYGVPIVVNEFRGENYFVIVPKTSNSLCLYKETPRESISFPSIRPEIRAKVHAIKENDIIDYEPSAFKPGGTNIISSRCRVGVCDINGNKLETGRFSDYIIGIEKLGTYSKDAFQTSAKKSIDIKPGSLNLEESLFEGISLTYYNSKDYEYGKIFINKKDPTEQAIVQDFEGDKKFIIRHNLFSGDYFTTASLIDAQDFYPLDFTGYKDIYVSIMLDERPDPDGVDDTEYYITGEIRKKHIKIEDGVIMYQTSTSSNKQQNYIVQVVSPKLRKKHIEIKSQSLDLEENLNPDDEGDDEDEFKTVETKNFAIGQILQDRTNGQYRIVNEFDNEPQSLGLSLLEDFNEDDYFNVWPELIARRFDKITFTGNIYAQVATEYNEEQDYNGNPIYYMYADENREYKVKNGIIQAKCSGDELIVDVWGFRELVKKSMSINAKPGKFELEEHI